MLQQTQVNTVLPYWERWMRALPTIRCLANAQPQHLYKLWEGLGYYSRVRNLHKAAQILVEQNGGRFPDTFEAMLALPGVGRYTAGAICSIAFNQPQPILDGNVTRVLSRLWAVGGDPAKKDNNSRLWRLAQALVQQAAHCSSPSPAGDWKNDHTSSRLGVSGTGPCSLFNQSLMELGALVCTARRPQCSLCPVARHCRARALGRTLGFPAPRARPKITPRRFLAVVWQHRGRFLARQRPAGLVNGHMWEFPSLELTGPRFGQRDTLQTLLGCVPSPLHRFCTIRHSITRYRITLEVYRTTDTRIPAGRLNLGLWLRPTQLTRLPFVSAHKRILQRLTNPPHEPVSRPVRQSTPTRFLKKRREVSPDPGL
jgi:A/G-specific adenine glycosylase